MGCIELEDTAPIPFGSIVWCDSSQLDTCSCKMVDITIIVRPKWGESSMRKASERMGNPSSPTR